MTRHLLPVPNPVPSYWLSEPHSLADLRSTPCLPQTCEVAVVGAGLAGVLSAYHILKRLDAEGAGFDQKSAPGAEKRHAKKRNSGEKERQKQETEQNGEVRVLLLDARELCSGATGRNGGHIKVQVSTLLNLPDSANDGGKKRTALHNYVQAVMYDLHRIAEDEDLPCEFELRRSFDVFTDAADAASMDERFETARCAGEKWTESVNWIGEDAEGITGVKGAQGAFSVPCASFWPYKFVTSLLEVMVRRWGEEGMGWLNVQMLTPVLSLSSITASSPDFATGLPKLSTDRGVVTAKKVVLATNAYTAGLVPSFQGVITPVKGMASHHTPAKPVLPRLSGTYNINYGPERGVDYLNPRPDGSIVVGGGSWLFRDDKKLWEGNWDDSRLFPHCVSGYWKGYMQERFLGWENSQAVNDHVWTGIMGRTRDGLPFVGRIPRSERVWLLAGFNGGGMALISLCAKAVCRMVVEDKGFDEVWEESGLLRGFGCFKERLR